MVPFCIFAYWQAQNPSFSLDIAWRYFADSSARLFRLGVYSGDWEPRQNHHIGSWNACAYCDRPIPPGDELCWNCTDEFGGICRCEGSPLRWLSSYRACVRRLDCSGTGTVPRRLHRFRYAVRLFFRSGYEAGHSPCCMRGDSQGWVLRRLAVAAVRSAYTSSRRSRLRFTSFDKS